MRHEVVWRCRMPDGGMLISHTMAPSDPVIIDTITTRTVPDASYDKASRTWSVPLTEIIVDFHLPERNR